MCDISREIHAQSANQCDQSPEKVQESTTTLFCNIYCRPMKSIEDKKKSRKDLKKKKNLIIHKKYEKKI